GQYFFDQCPIRGHTSRDQFVGEIIALVVELRTFLAGAQSEDGARVMFEEKPKVFRPAKRRGCRGDRESRPACCFSDERDRSRVVLRGSEFVVPINFDSDTLFGGKAFSQRNGSFL